MTFYRKIQYLFAFLYEWGVNLLFFNEIKGEIRVAESLLFNQIPNGGCLSNGKNQGIFIYYFHKIQSRFIPVFVAGIIVFMSEQLQRIFFLQFDQPFVKKCCCLCHAGIFVKWNIVVLPVSPSHIQVETGINSLFFQLGHKIIELVQLFRI